MLLVQRTPGRRAVLAATSCAVLLGMATAAAAQPSSPKVQRAAATPTAARLTPRERAPASASFYCGSDRPYVVLASWTPWLSSTSVQHGGLYIELRRSDGCHTAWAYIKQFSGDPWRGVVSVWNPGQSSQTAWSLPYGDETGMIWDGSGVQACVGVQVYYNGAWNRWLFLGCRWGS